MVVGAFPSFDAWQLRVWHVPYPATKYFVLIVVSITAMLASRRPLSHYGLRPGAARPALLVALAAFVPFTLASLPFMFGATPNGMPAACALAVLHFAMLFGIGWSLRSARRIRDNAVAGAMVLASFVTASFFVGHPYDAIPSLALTLLVNAPGEELFFRGFVQGELDAAYGKPFSSFGVRWGHGAVVASVFFALTHVWMFDLELQSVLRNWPWGLWVGLFGFGLSLLREKTKGLLAPSLAHALPHCVGILFVGHA
jgi:membrane protease YdiL (CAAX protease family)